MATLITNSNRNGNKSKTLAPTVDLTAMVDLAFLLITFFMLTTSLSKEHALDLAKPVPVEDELQLQPYPASRTLTLLLGRNHKIGYFLGEADRAHIKTTNVEGLGQIISSHKQLIHKTVGNRSKGLIVIIKPSSQSSYQNLVDALDELKIYGIQQYAIDDQYFQKRELGYLSKQL